jgi:hypothetical protein
VQRTRINPSGAAHKKSTKQIAVCLGQCWRGHLMSRSAAAISNGWSHRGVEVDHTAISAEIKVHAFESHKANQPAFRNDLVVRETYAGSWR